LDTSYTTTTFRGCKVAILGARRSGKSRLANALVQTNEDLLNNASVRVRHLHSQEDAEYREMSLWDFSGHDGYRVIHELLLDNVDIVLLTIDFTQSHADQYEAIEYWSDVMRRVETKQTYRIVRYLVVTKTESLRRRDRNPKLLTRLAHKYGMDDIFLTSCRRGDGIDDLRQALYDTIQWKQTQLPARYDDLLTLVTCINRRHYDDYILDRHQLYVELLDASPDLVSTADYNQLLNALQLRGTLFQFPQKDDLIFDLNVLEYYVAQILEIPRQKGGRKSHNKQFFPVSRSDILQHPVPVDLPISDDQHRQLNGLILHFLAFRNLLILDNQEIIFLSNLVQELSIKLEDLNSALILDMRLFPSINFPQLIVRVNRSQEFQLEEYWSNRAIFENQYGKYQIIHPASTQTLTEIWIHCSPNTPDYDRLLFETYVYDLITDMGNVATLETRRHYVCESCGTPFAPEELDGKVERIACVVCQSINYVPIRPSQLDYEDQLKLLQDAEQIVKQSVAQFNRSLANYKIELSKLDNTIDCMLIFERDSDVANYVLQINGILRNDGMNTFLMPTRGMNGIDLNQLAYHLGQENISRIVYFVGGNQQVKTQTPLIDCIHTHYQPMQIYFMVVAIHPTIIRSRHPIINRGFNVIEWSPDKRDSSIRLLDRIRDNRMQGVEDVYGRLDTPSLQEFPYFGQAILHFFSIDNITPLYYDTHPDDVMELLNPATLDLHQFWRAELAISQLIINRAESLIYLRQAQDDNEFKLIMKLRKRYNVEFIIIIDVNVIVPFPFKGNSKFIHLDVRALRNLIKTVNRDGWFRRYLVRNLRGGGPNVIEKMLPFDTNKIADEAVFFGRDDFIADIRQEIAEEALVGRFIFGPKRSGKTSLLHRIKGMLADTKYEPILLTAGGSLSIQSFIQSILSWLELDVDDDVTPEDWIAIMQQFQWDYHRTPVLLLDEMDQLIQEDSQKGFQLSRAIADLAHDEICVFFLAGHSILRREASNGYSIYYGLMDSYYATGIEEKAAYRLLQEIVTKVDFIFTPEQLADIYEGTGGIPYLMIHFCQGLLNSMVSNLEEDKTSFDREIKDFEIERVKANRGFLSTVHNYFMYDHHEFLAIILKLISESDTITREEIITYLDNLQIPNARDESDKVFESLIDLFKIVDEQPTGTLSIKPRYLHQALKKNIGKHTSFDEMETYLLSED